LIKQKLGRSSVEQMGCARLRCAPAGHQGSHFACTKEVFIMAYCTTARRLGLLGIPAAILAGAGPAAGQALFSDQPDVFPIGVWQQPSFNFDKWQARGVNTLVEVPGGHDTETAYWADWVTQAKARSFNIIRQPDPTVSLSDDLTRGGIDAFMLRDEPDYRDVDPAQTQAQYTRLKQAAKHLPVLANFSGGTVLGAGTQSGKKVSDDAYRSYLAGADWVANDIYPVTGWGRADWIDYSQSSDGARRNPGAAIDKLRTLSGEKPQLAIIETSNQRLGWVPNSRSVTPDELRGQVWHSIIHGAKGVVYFPLAFNGFKFDNTPAEVAAEITATNARIQSLATVLNDTWNEDAPGHGEPGEKLSFVGDAGGLLEGSWRHTADADYFFVLNMSSTGKDTPVELTFGIEGAQGLASIIGEDRTLSTADGEGSVDWITDSFTPWEMQVYKFARQLGEVTPADPTSPTTPVDPGTPTIPTPPQEPPRVIITPGGDHPPISEVGGSTEDGTVVPEPGALGVALGGALIALRRRRRVQ
jgi:hypothetical protein